MIRYRADHFETPRPVAVECEVRGYPNLDADGEKQYDNTHFDDEESCWECLLSNADAAVAIACNNIAELNIKLEEAKNKLVTMTMFRNSVISGKRENKTNEQKR